MARIAARFVTLALVFFSALPSSEASPVAPACVSLATSLDDCLARCTYGFPTFGRDRWGNVVVKASAGSAQSLCAAFSASATSSTAAPAPTLAGALAGAAESDPKTTTSSKISSSTSSTKISTSSSVIPSTSSTVVASAKFTTNASPKVVESTTKPIPTTTKAVVTTPKPAPTTQQAPPKTTQAPLPPAVVNSPPPSQSSSGGTSASDKAAYLAAHNNFRAQHGASPLVFDDTLAAAAQKWANKCVFEHSGGSLGPFGENLAAGTGSDYDIAAGIKGWTDEAKDYDPSNPVFSHFTQVVWKATTKVGCAVASCDNIFPGSTARYYVCEYSVQGNVSGQFAANVQA